MPDITPSKIAPLDPTAAEPYYRQIYERFRHAIASGLLKPGDRIPSARALTRELGLARGTMKTITTANIAMSAGLASAQKPGS